MSGAELRGLISEVASLIDASVRNYKAAEDVSYLPISFRDIAARLPLIQESLNSATNGLEADSLPDGSHAALKTVLEKCAERATSLHDIFQDVISAIPPTDASPTVKHILAMKTLSKATKGGELVDGIMGDLQILTANGAFKTATKTQIESLAADVKKKEQPAQEDQGGRAVSWRNKGPGTQYIYNGAGNQNIAMDRATQVNGTFQGGTFNFHG